MGLLDLCVWVGLLLTLPHCAHPTCTDGTPEECADAEFAPGTNLAGEGFDITKMERKSAFVINMNHWKRQDEKCTLCTNTFMENKQQKIPLSVVDWRAKLFCSMKVTSKLHRSSESLVTSSTSSVTNNWKAGLEVDVNNKGGSLMLAGTHSRLAQYSMEKTKEDKYSFASQSMFCEYYSYRVSNQPVLDREFENAVKNLPETYSLESQARFYKLIDIFGTHYITKVKVGGEVHSVTSIKQCEAHLKGLSAEEVGMCLEAEASASVKAKLSTEIKHCNNYSQKSDSKATFSNLFNDRKTTIKGGDTTEPDLLFSADKEPSAYQDWLNTIPAKPDVISYSLEPLHELLPASDPSRKNLRLAISHYILEKSLLSNCSGRCQAGVRSSHSDPCVCSCHNDPAVSLDCCPSRRGMARVIITVVRAEDLWGDSTSATDGYVKVFVNDMQVRQSPVINDNNNPRWDMPINLGAMELSADKQVKFQVWDQDNTWDDDLLGTCYSVLTEGIRDDVCAMMNGRLYYKLDVKCAPNLGGKFCMEYRPSPMSPSLSSQYVSRHSRPIPKAMLLKMGVFVSESGSPRNQTL